MKQSIRLLSAVISFCFIISSFSAVQSYAISNEAAAVTQKQDAQRTEEDKEDTGVNDGQDGNTVDTGVDADVTDPDKAPADEAAENTAVPQEEVKDEDAAKNEEDIWYRKQNPMKKEHQKLLWDYCEKRDLDYIDMLALIYTESNFNEKTSTGKHHGYFQISTGNCANLAETLKTKNKPLDGAININWGTAMYGWILADKRVKGLKEEKKRDAALSIYQRGTGGYDKYGISTSFLKIFYKKRAIVSKWFESQ